MDLCNDAIFFGILPATYDVTTTVWQNKAVNDDKMSMNRYIYVRTKQRFAFGKTPQQ